MGIYRKRETSRLCICALILIALAGAGVHCSKEASDNAPGKKAEQEQPVAEKTATGKVVLHFFYGKECTHCNRIKPDIESLSESYPGLEVLKYEVWHDAANQELLVSTLEGKKRVEVPGKSGTSQGVPTTIVGDEYYVGSDMGVIRGMAVRGLRKAKAGQG
ncbi:MAG: thioredoxin [Spirochaetes bacterium]|nr:MAG: thioredoxin [Spirochaetota bacterium]